MKVVAIIQARMTSSRLPGKVLLPLRNNELVLDSVYNRIKKSSMIDEVVIATSNDASDDKIRLHCDLNGYNCFRGDLNDVLKRFYTCATSHEADVVVRITADCPLVDYRLNDELLRFFFERKLDYAGITHGEHALGITTEVFTSDSLSKAYKHAVPPHREHVTTFMYTNPLLFNCLRMPPEGEFRESKCYRLTLDTQADYQVIKSIYENIHSKYITIKEVNDYLKGNKDIANLNLF